MMKRANNLIEKIAAIENLRLAFWKAKKGKSDTPEVELYRKDLEINLLSLQNEILKGSVCVGDYYYFKIYEPKERQICASAFREQVLHHALMNLCDPYFEKHLIYDSYASRKGKGVYGAVERAKVYNKKHLFYLKLDVKKFFESVEHTVLKLQLRKIFKEQKLITIFDQIIDSYEAHPNKGLPIGNLTSQYFANHYLSPLDHFIKEDLKTRAYIRYMDDMVLWDTDKQVLKDKHKAILSFCENTLKCNLKPEQLNQTCKGLPFLGYQFFPFHLKLSQMSKQRFIRKSIFAETKYHTALWSEPKSQLRILPLLAFINHAQTARFTTSFFSEEKGQLSERFEPRESRRELE
jgi:RNA-directed DNA polymerase